MARILVYTPTYDDMLRPETVASVEAQQFDGELDYRIDDRSLHPGRSMLEVCEKYRDARQWTLDGGYDALLTVEHDMILPPNCVQALWDTDAPVVYAAYMLRHGTRVINIFRYEGKRNLGMSLSLHPSDLKRAMRNESVECSGGGFGCTLMKREALVKVPFKVFEKDPPDMAFAGECVRAGIKQIGRFDVACLHMDEKGVRLSVAEEATNCVRVEALQDVTCTDIERIVSMKRGRYYTMALTYAKEHERAGYVRIVDDGTEAARETSVAEPYDTAEAPVKKVAPKKRAPRKRTTRKRTTKKADDAVSGDSDEASGGKK